MSQFNREVVESKLTDLLRFLEEFEKVIGSSFETFTADFRNVRTAERDLELIVEYATDVLTHLLVARDLPPPDSYRDAFLRAAREGLLPADLAERLAVLVSLRNRLMHEYTSAYDPRRAYDGFQSAPPLLRAFTETIFAKLQQ